MRLFGCFLENPDGKTITLPAAGKQAGSCHPPMRSVCRSKRRGNRLRLSLVPPGQDGVHAAALCPSPASFSGFLAVGAWFRQRSWQRFPASADAGKNRYRQIRANSRSERGRPPDTPDSWGRRPWLGRSPGRANVARGFFAGGASRARPSIYSLFSRRW